MFDVFLYGFIIFVAMWATTGYLNVKPPSVIECILMFLVSLVLSLALCGIVEEKKNKPIEKRIGCVEFNIDRISLLEYRDPRMAAKEYYFVKSNKYGIARLEFEQVKPSITDGKVYASLYLVENDKTVDYYQEIRDVSCQIR